MLTEGKTLRPTKGPTKGPTKVCQRPRAFGNALLSHWCLINMALSVSGSSPNGTDSELSAETLLSDKIEGGKSGVSRLHVLIGICHSNLGDTLIQNFKPINLSRPSQTIVAPCTLLTGIVERVH